MATPSRSFPACTGRGPQCAGAESTADAIFLGLGLEEGGFHHGERGRRAAAALPNGAGVRTVPGQPQLPQLPGSEGILQGQSLRQLPEVLALLEGAGVRQIPQVPPVPPHAGAAAARTLPQGAGERPVRQVHRRAANPPLAALLPQAHAPPAGPGRAAAPHAAHTAASSSSSSTTATAAFAAAAAAAHATHAAAAAPAEQHLRQVSPRRTPPPSPWSGQGGPRDWSALRQQEAWQMGTHSLQGDRMGTLLALEWVALGSEATQRAVRRRSGGKATFLGSWGSGSASPLTQMDTPSPLHAICSRFPILTVCCLAANEIKARKGNPLLKLYLKRLLLSFLVLLPWLSALKALRVAYDCDT